MEEEYEIISLTNSDGDEEDFEVVMSFEVENNDYVALLPVVAQYGDDEEVLLFKVTTDGIDTTFMPIEDEDEFNIVAEAYYEFLEE